MCTYNYSEYMPFSLRYTPTKLSNVLIIQMEQDIFFAILYLVLLCLIIVMCMKTVILSWLQNDGNRGSL